jgi:hypothetical protein
MSTEKNYRTKRSVFTTLAVYVLLLQSTVLFSQTTIFSNEKFRLVELPEKPASEVHYQLFENTGGKEVLKAQWGHDYQFNSAVLHGVFYVSRYPEKEKKEFNLFNPVTGSFISNWSTGQIIPFSDSLFKLSEEKGPGLKEWTIITNSGKVLFTRKARSRWGPEADSKTKLIYFPHIRDTVTLYRMDGSIFKEYTGYSYPRFVDSNLVLMNNLWKYGLIDLNGSTLIPFDNDELDFINGKAIRLRTVNGVQQAEVYETGQAKPFFTRPASQITESASYKDHVSGKYVPYFSLLNGKVAEYYTEQGELFLKWPATEDEYQGIEYGFGTIFLLQNVSDDAPPVLAMNSTIIAQNPKANLTVTDIVNDKRKAIKDFIAVSDPDQYKNTLQVFSKEGKAVPYKLLYEKEDSWVYMIDIGKGPQIANLMYGVLTVYDSTVNYIPVRAVVSSKEDNGFQAFLFNRDGKTGAALFSFYNPENTNGFVCKTPAFFDKVQKVYCSDYAMYIAGIVNGNKCVAVCVPNAFHFIFLDEFPDMKNLHYYWEDSAPQVKAKKDGQTIYIDGRLRILKK